MINSSDNVYLQKFMKKFDDHMNQIDELVQVTIKGHLIIEGALDDIIELIFFHPQHLKDCRLSFYQKVQIARAFCLRKNEVGTWNVILAVNELRNGIAHTLVAEKRAAKMAALRKMYFEEVSPQLGTTQKDTPDHVIAYLACALCAGFLSSYAQDTVTFRRLIESMDAVLNPGEKRVKAAPKS